ncbi:hypothetical protein [Nocardiopsis synnemataformans]|uniref:hypothetical protein n=1 Tax=Nocardiopsis synnemataformans TaxID=61305 RepID=UPI003EBC450C
MSYTYVDPDDDRLEIANGAITATATEDGIDKESVSVRLPDSEEEGLNLVRTLLDAMKIRATITPISPTNPHIYAGREFVSLAPRDSITLVVAEYDGGEKVTVTDTNGKRKRSIKASSLLPTGIRPDGTRIKNGYAPTT